MYKRQVYTRLEDESDPVIAKLGLSEGYTVDGELVNYGVSSPNVSVGKVPSTSFLCSNGQPAHSVECSTFTESDCGTNQRSNCCPYEDGYVYLVCDGPNGYCCPSP